MRDCFWPKARPEHRTAWKSGSEARQHYAKMAPHRPSRPLLALRETLPHARALTCVNHHAGRNWFFRFPRREQLEHQIGDDIHHHEPKC